MAAVDSSGFPTRPVANELIESAWGSAVRDRLWVREGWTASGPTPFGNGAADMYTVTIPAVPFDSVVVTTTAWELTYPAAGASFAGWVQPLGGGTASASSIVLPIPTGLYGTFTLPFRFLVVANANPSYKIVVALAGMGSPTTAQVLTQTVWHQVVVRP